MSLYHSILTITFQCKEPLIPHWLYWPLLYYDSVHPVVPYPCALDYPLCVTVKYTDCVLLIFFVYLIPSPCLPHSKHSKKSIPSKRSLSLIISHHEKHQGLCFRSTSSVNPHHWHLHVMCILEIQGQSKNVKDWIGQMSFKEFYSDCTFPIHQMYKIGS